MVDYTPGRDEVVVYYENFNRARFCEATGQDLLEQMSKLKGIARLVRDDRSHVVSIVPAKPEPATLLHYLIHMCYSMMMMSTKSKNKYIDGLRAYGYVPLVFTPQPDYNELGIKIASLAYDAGLPLYKTYAYRINRSDYCIGSHDYWVHKFDAAKFLGCEPKDVLADNLFGKVVGNGDALR